MEYSLKNFCFAIGCTCSALAIFFVLDILPAASATHSESVPFTSQAPLGRWSDPRQQNGCEEASALMALAWAQGFPVTPQSAKNTILAISAYEKKTYGSFIDTSAQDTVERIIKNYFHYPKVKTQTIASVQDMIAALGHESLIIVPVNGRLLGNPFYTLPGPEHHMLVIIGVDEKKRELITNDPGTRHGNQYRYGMVRLFKAIQDYPTGDHARRTSIEKIMIVVKK